MVEVVIERESGGGEVSSIVPGRTAVCGVHCTHITVQYWTSLSSILPVHIGEENIVVQCSGRGGGLSHILAMFGEALPGPTARGSNSAVQ